MSLGSNVNHILRVCAPFCRIFAIVQDSDEMNNPHSDLRYLLRQQGQTWRDLKIPIEGLILIGDSVIDAMQPLFSASNVRSQDLESAMAFLYKESMQFVMLPLLLDQNLREEATRFYKDVAVELNWNPQVLQKRMFEVNMEISAIRQYTHTKEELERGARLAWRNSAKCIGR